MTLFEKVTSDVETLACFMQGLIEGTEERILYQLKKQGVEASIVRIHQDLQIADNVKQLLEEL